MNILDSIIYDKFTTVLLEDFVITKGDMETCIINIIKVVEDKVGPPETKVNIEGAGVSTNSVEVGSKVPSKAKLKPSRGVLSPSKIQEY